MKDVMGAVAKIISLVKYSPEGENMLGNIKDLIHFESLDTDDKITFKLKDIAIMQTHIVPLLRSNTSGNNILKTSPLSYHQLKTVSINLLSRYSSKWSSSC